MLKLEPMPKSVTELEGFLEAEKFKFTLCDNCADEIKEAIENISGGEIPFFINHGEGDGEDYVLFVHENRAQIFSTGKHGAYSGLKAFLSIYDGKKAPCVEIVDGPDVPCIED